MDWFKDLRGRTKLVASTYTWIFVAVLTLNQLLFFGFCLNPVCIIAAMPHCLAITLFLGSILNNLNGWGEKNKVKEKYKTTEPLKKIQPDPHMQSSRPSTETSVKANTSSNKQSSQARNKYDNPNRDVTNSTSEIAHSLINTHEKADPESSSHAPFIVTSTGVSRPSPESSVSIHLDIINRQKRFQLKKTVKDRIKIKKRADMESRFGKMSRKVSTTELGKIYGVKASPYLFDHFLKLGIIQKIDNKYEVTPSGIELGGAYNTNEKGQRWVVWDTQRIAETIQEYKIDFVNILPFENFMHITHIDNLSSILQHGLLPHNNKYQNKDISNNDVNDRRERQEPVFNHKLHDFVPFYINVKNSMLFQVQKKYGDSVVILSLSKNICLSKKTVFSYGNAATNDAEFSSNIIDINNFDWDLVFSPEWSSDGIVNKEIKKKMMSECLIYGGVSSENIVAINCLSQKTQDRVEKICSKFNIGAQIVSDRRFFFD